MAAAMGAVTSSATPRAPLTSSFPKADLTSSTTPTTIASTDSTRPTNAPIWARLENPDLRHPLSAMTGRSQLQTDNRTPRNRSEEHTSELQSLMRISYAVFCLKKKTTEHTLNTRKLTATNI